MMLYRPLFRLQPSNCYYYNPSRFPSSATPQLYCHLLFIFIDFFFGLAVERIYSQRWCFSDPVEKCLFSSQIVNWPWGYQCSMLGGKKTLKFSKLFEAHSYFSRFLVITVICHNSIHGFAVMFEPFNLTLLDSFC